MKRRASLGTMLHGYMEQEVAKFLGFHFTSGSRIMKHITAMLRK
jgi:hypothetical protein